MLWGQVALPAPWSRADGSFPLQRASPELMQLILMAGRVGSGRGVNVHRREPVRLERQPNRSLWQRAPRAHAELMLAIAVLSHISGPRVSLCPFRTKKPPVQLCPALCCHPRLVHQQGPPVQAGLA